MKTPKTVIVTGASQGIGACVVKTFLERGYQVVASTGRPVLLVCLPPLPTGHHLPRHSEPWCGT